MRGDGTLLPAELSPAVQDTTATPVRGEERVAGDYTVATLAGTFSALISFGSATLTTRLLAPEAFGALSLVLVTSLVIQMTTSSWTSLAVARFGRETLDRGGTMSAVTRARITIVGPWMLIAIAAVLALKALGALPAQLTWPLVGAAIAHGIVATAYEHCTNLMRSLGRQRLAAVAVLAQQIVIVAILGWLLAAGLHVSTFGISMLYVGGTILLLLLYLPTVWGVGLRRVPRDLDLERRMRQFSTPLILFTVSSYVVGSIDLWVLGAFASSSAVGSYAAAYRAYAVLMTVASAASPVLMTLFVSLRLAGRGKEISRFLLSTAPALMLVAGAVAAVLIAPAYVLAPIVFSRAFSSAALPLAILIVAVVAYLESCLVGTVLTAHDRTADAARAIFVAAVLNVVGDLDRDWRIRRGASGHRRSRPWHQT